MRRLLLACLVLACACDQSEVRKKLRDERCARNLDCAYGLECVDAAGVSAAVARPDAGTPASPGKTCQFKSFGDCEGDGTQAAADGQPQCLSSYRCRAGHCTVQCAGHADCKPGEVCKVGMCQGGANVRGTCYDNRDCPYPETCFYGQCVTRTPAMRCVSDLDCAGGMRCINGACQ